MNDRDCKNCKHHTEKGCDSWDCEFDQRMKRKEIIEMLKVLKNQALESHNDTAIIDVKKDSFMYVMNAAIKELAQEPCEDAVSRRAINNLRKYNLVGGISTVSLKDINKLPSVNPQEPCEDAISRQAVLDIINFEDKWLLDAKGHNADTEIAFSGMKSGIAELPSVNPQEPKTGHWIKTSLTEVSGGDFKRGFKCSHCNYVIVTNDFNFCPNCGAKMQEVEA